MALLRTKHQEQLSVAEMCGRTGRGYATQPATWLSLNQSNIVNFIPPDGDSVTVARNGWPET